MRLTLTSKQFCQIMMCILYDQLVRPDETLPILIDQDYNDLMTLFKNRGMRTILQQYYMRLDPQMRVRHRFIRNVYLDNNKTKNVFIEIRKDEKPKEMEGKVGLVRRTGEFLAKVLTLGLYNKK
jgi:hypothetical protein